MGIGGIGNVKKSISGHLWSQREVSRSCAGSAKWRILASGGDNRLHWLNNTGIYISGLRSYYPIHLFPRRRFREKELKFWQFVNILGNLGHFQYECMYEYTKPLSKLRVSGRYSDTGIRFLNSGTAICNQVDFLFDFLLRVYVTYSRPNDLDNVSCFFRLVIIITTKFYVDISTLIRQNRQKTISSPALELSAFQPVTIDEVRKLLTSTSRKTSPLDVLPVSLLKDCADVFAPAITILANLSLQTGRFPTRFKSAQVLPLLKKAGLDRSSPANYRPISNLSTVS